MISPHMDVVVDLQFGSTGKGAVVGYLTNTNEYQATMSAWAPNAGHTVYTPDGQKFVHCMVPCAFLWPHVQYAFLGPGSVLDIDLLVGELRNMIACGKTGGSAGDKIIYIHEHAAVVMADHARMERDTLISIGSTMKGSAAAVMQKMGRPTDECLQNIAKHWREHFDVTINPELQPHRLEVRVVNQMTYDAALAFMRRVIVEGAQGYSLGLNRGFYPYTTSRDCSVAQLMSDCSVPWYMARRARVWGVARTYPIRVANRFDADGNQIGWSGPCYEDQRETSWPDIGREAEMTTVTKLPRRIFTWSDDQFEEALQYNGVHRVALTFADYLQEDTRGKFIGRVERLCKENNAQLALIGTGPTLGDMHPCSQ
jgi:adenylosuccinate synthase